MVALVVDASVVIAWSMPDEGLDNALGIESAVLREGMLVPAHWHLEVANTIRTLEKRSRLTMEEGKGILAKLELLNVQVDRQTSNRAFHATMELSRKHGLTLYDAAYLELAIREERRLATLDRALFDAAQAEGVAIVALAA